MGSKLGYIYAPYVFFMLAPLKEDGRHGLLSRYDKKLIDSKVYGKFRVEM